MLSLTIPNTVTTIGDGAFESCESLRSVFIGNSVASGKGAFSFCKALSTITLAEGTTQIPRSFFEACHGLKEIEIPDTVTEIGEYAFASCVNLTKITIPNGVIEIKDGTFTSCYALKTICCEVMEKPSRGWDWGWCEYSEDINFVWGYTGE